MVAGSGVEQPAGSRALLHGAVGSLTCVVNPILHVIETALLQRNYFRGADAGEGKEMRKRGWPIEVESSFHGILTVLGWKIQQSVIKGTKVKLGIK